MPGYDGTGPNGLGPITGRGTGYCLIKLSESSGEPAKGFAGRSGYPVVLSSGSHLTELQARLRQIETALTSIQHRIAILETAFVKPDK